MNTNVKFGASVLVLFLLCHYVDSKSKCETCSDIVEKFYEGLKTTAKSNFGGGNTHWEEKSLGSFAFSETRLIEILDNVCDGNECHSMLEEHEEAIEQWWFKHYAKKKDTKLHTYLCIERVSGACCKSGTWGAKCKPCPGFEEDLICGGHGKCDGNGTREGTGKCDCEDGYAGDTCTQCDDDYYEHSTTGENEEITTTCEECHESCEGGCSGPGSKTCNACKEDGWATDEEQGCIDINECEADGDICKETEFCTNNEGSYYCTGCHSACHGCTASGPENCMMCADGYFDQEGTCRACHSSCSKTCTDNTAKGCDSCKEGWLWHDEHGCQDINECDENPCTEEQYCVNQQGTHKCKECDAACKGCTGIGNKNCRECANGYSLEDSKCVDVNECEADDVCGDNEMCENTAGAHACKCKDGFTRSKDGACVQKDSKNSKQSSSSSSKSKSSSKAKKKGNSTASKHKSIWYQIKRFLQSKLGMYTIQYIAALMGYAFVGNVLRSSRIAQLLFSWMFWLYILWFSMRFDGPTGKKGDW